MDIINVCVCGVSHTCWILVHSASIPQQRLLTTTALHKFTYLLTYHGQAIGVCLWTANNFWTKQPFNLDTRIWHVHSPWPYLGQIRQQSQRSKFTIAGWKDIFFRLWTHATTWRIVGCMSIFCVKVIDATLVSEWFPVVQKNSAPSSINRQPAKLGSHWKMVLKLVYVSMPAAIMNHSLSKRMIGLLIPGTWFLKRTYEIVGHRR